MIVIRKMDGLTSGRIVEQIVCEKFGPRAKVLHTKSGAPYLEGIESDQEHYITISHTKDYVTVIISRNRVGVDIETSNRDVSRVEHRFASQNETKLCRAVFELNAPLMVWCAKEALYKYYDRRSVDFLRDFVIIEANDTKLVVMAFGTEKVELAWRIMEHENILLLHTL